MNMYNTLCFLIKRKLTSFLVCVLLYIYRYALRNSIDRLSDMFCYAIRLQNHHELHIQKISKISKKLAKKFTTTLQCEYNE